MLSKIDSELYNLDDAICRHIDDISRYSRGVVSQDVLSDLRHYVEHIMFKIYDNGRNLEVTYDNIKEAIRYISSSGKYKFLRNFHEMLQIVVSHYKPTEENSERLMLKYYEYLFRIRTEMNKDYSLNLLHNLEKFPLNMDPKLMEYYQKIANEVDKYKCIIPENADRFYIHKIKPFFMNKSIYYEVTFSPANDYSSKTDRVIAFTKIPIESNYAFKMNFTNTSIEIMEHKMPILIIVWCEISIRECEFKNFIKLVEGKQNQVRHSERMALCSFMTKSKLNLLDIVSLKKTEYNLIKEQLTVRPKVTNFFNVLDTCRRIINSDSNGKNILRYLLFTMNNTIIKNQYESVANSRLSNLYLKNGVIPFDSIPFTFSLIKHNPPFNILINCFEADEHKSEFLARCVKNNTECNGDLFTSLKEIDESGETIKKIMVDYNEKLWHGHRPNNELKIDKGQIFIQKYVEDCRFIINRLKKLSEQGISNYTNSASAWLNEENNGVDCEEKKEVIKYMFANSTVAILYGAAGTGKSTLINHVSHFFSDKDKLFLAQTNPAIDNLKRKVNASNCEFMTITKFILNNRISTEYDILIIDECSTVSNSDMRKLLEKAIFKLLILVGDTYQIESIRFGNWFNIAQQFIPETSSWELTKTYRSNDSRLLELWNGVRKMDHNVLELITKQKYSNKLDDSIFQVSNKDEIILCLNYDGLYGINNINRFLQESNPSKSVLWGIQTFKVGDPILFHDLDRFSPVIYNNMKGRILNVSIFSDGNVDERIEFDVELDKVINGMDVIDGEFELLEHDIYEEANNSVIRFSVYKNKNTDTDDFDSRTIVPFQVSYAVSIHKAQGLEYNSVKIVITNEVDEMITHNIFYTAITRAKSQLKIYWSPEVENKILSTIKPKDNNKDAKLLYKIQL
ncbi:putative helicase [Ureaplasma urealyticum serovar 2 str. ATCC 27814]|uniref:ATP-dependent DNA helicase n=1 Tax=Ureaplasma urealyticum TaxID=2130 RepID=UPI000179413F|nr:ATP-dependent RecD-like DNA helicase [Ureaplasma urealyticum]EEH02384.1 putative helicase [Ureaplasma urealyticum serovar 2 str. ATCC 27814]